MPSIMKPLSNVFTTVCISAHAPTMPFSIQHWTNINLTKVIPYLKHLSSNVINIKMMIDSRAYVAARKEEKKKKGGENKEQRN